MPEPKTRLNSVPPQPEESPGETTGGWVAPAAPGGEEKAATATYDRSTPGPAQPQLRTSTELTELIGPAPYDPATLPDIPGYRVEQLIGRGGMATVYRAVHVEMNRVVALKLINPGGRDEFYVRERFEREIQTLASIEHPHVVPVYACGYWHGFPFLTMKFISAGPLSQHIDRFHGRPEAAARLLARVARGVQALHDRGILHRDLKPLNILLGDHDEPLVADFGLAKWMDDGNSEITVTHVPIGTRQYMSPEQTLGQKARYAAACDIWSMGVTLYELLAGARPFSDADTGELFERIRNSEPPPLPTSVPEPLAAIVSRCLAKKPEHRYSTAAELAIDLERWQFGQPITVPASPPPPPRPTPTWAIALGIAAILATIFLPPALVPLGRAQEERDPDSSRAALVREPFEPMRSIAERLRSGETVVLVGPTGMPVHEWIPVPGSLGRPTTDYQGFLTLNSSGLAGVVLVHEWLPMRVRLEAEVALLEAPADRSWCSVFVGARETPTPTGPVQSLIQLVQENSFSGKGADSVMTQEAKVELVWWHENAAAEQVQVGSTKRIIPLPNGPGKEPRWCKMQVEIDPKHIWNVVPVPDRIEMIWNDQPIRVLLPGRLLSAPSIADFFNRMYRMKNRTTENVFQQPIIGPGMGLSVRNATAVFRNVRLVPLAP